MRRIEIGPIHLGRRPAVTPAAPDAVPAVAPITGPARTPARRRAGHQQRGIGGSLTRVALAGAILVAGVEGGMLYSNSQKPSTEGTGAAASASPATPRSSDAAGSANPGASLDAGASASPDVMKVEAGLVVFTGIPAQVDSGRVDTAKGVFKNTIGKGTEMAFAEPGGLLVGPDFGFTGKGNPMGNNPKGWVAMYNSEGNIQPISPVSQEVLHYEGPAYQNVPEGGWMIMSTGQAHVKIGNYEVDLPFVENNNYLLVVRGKYGDQKQNTDNNSTAEITNYKPGHALVMSLESGQKANIGFLSQGQLSQMAETSHSGGTNLGDGGASKLTLVILDVNTGAEAVLQQNQGRNQDGSKNWVSVNKNW